jgi:hypothetical protein
MMVVVPTLQDLCFSILARKSIKPSRLEKILPQTLARDLHFQKIQLLRAKFLEHVNIIC